MSMRRLCGIVSGLLLSCSLAARADDTEDAAAKWAVGAGGTLTRNEKVPGKPVVEVAFGPLNKKVTNDGLKELKGFKSLKGLTLFFCEQIGDDGMKHVKELTGLEKLVLGNTSVTDTGMAELKGLKKLKSLTVSGAIRMTDKSTHTIMGFTDLEYLSLPSTITETGVKRLVGLKKLRTLYLSGTAVGDDAVADITALTELEELYLGTGVTDAAIDDLAKLTKLTKLSLFGSKVTAAGLKSLRAQLPECTITK